MPDLSPTRREFLQNTSLGFGALALSCLLETDRARAATHDRISHELSPRLGHFTSQAKSVIMLFQNGGASQRSEEHTSELQSLVTLVCRLLLEKKKTNTHDTTIP